LGDYTETIYKSTMKFSLIICGYNEEQNLDLCIQSCLDQNYPKEKYEIIYVDNNSADNSLEIAKKYPIKIFTEKKQGPSEARNKGIKESAGEILLFLDADLKIDSNYLLLCETKTFTDSSTGAGIGKVLPLKETWVSNYLGVSLFEGYPRFRNFKYMYGCPSCNLAIRKSVLNKIGSFQETLTSANGVTRFAEDKEICERIRKSNFNILYNPGTFIFHENNYIFKKLLLTWIKGSRGRANMIRLNKKDPFTLLFKFNIPLLYLACIILFLFCIPIIAYSLVVFAIFSIIILATKALVETGLIFQSIFVKPWMDVLSLIIINISVIYFRWKTY
jgi:glycosyltransferase involved in cell wall biosynthesis